MPKLRTTSRLTMILLPTLLLAAAPLAARDLPRAVPEEVGMSTERLERLTAVLQSYVLQQFNSYVHRFVPSLPSDQKGHHRILQGIKLLQQIVELEDKPDFFVSKSTQAAVIKLVDPLATGCHLTRCRSVQPTQNVEQCALSNSGVTGY